MFSLVCSLPSPASLFKLSLLGSALSPDFVTDGRSLILHGKSGRGKTHIAVAVGYRKLHQMIAAILQSRIP